MARLRRGVGPWGLLAGGVAVSVDELGAASPRRRGVAAAHRRACPGAAGLFSYAGVLEGWSMRRVARHYGEVAAGLALQGGAAAVALAHGR